MGKFIPDYTSIATPLPNLIMKHAPNKVVWNKECGEAFQKLKALLCANVTMSRPREGVGPADVCLTVWGWSCPQPTG